MIITVPGELYLVESIDEFTREQLLEFFQTHSENDIIEVKNKKERFHITYHSLLAGEPYRDLSIVKTPDIFIQAIINCPLNGVIPVIDNSGNYISILKQVPTYYLHYYCYEGGLDLTFLNRYDSICLSGVNEYSFGLYRKALPRNKNPDKKFFLIDGCFRIEGIFGFWEKITIAAKYAKAKGYEPVVNLVSSEENMYSDFPEDDIWSKFFQQPGDYPLDEALHSNYVVLSPNMNILNILQHIMLEESAGIELLWPNGLYNDRVRRYISARMEKFLPDPQHTLGVLIRGTDYRKTTLPGHFRHADTDMVIQKIKEVWHTWGDFEFIYLATEDEEICAEMKQEFGLRLTCTDQQRYTIEEGHLLSELHQEKEAKDGFRLGAEYLCSLSLLSRCHSLIASGGCCGVSEAIRENAGKYKNIYVFDLGLNPRL